jgi:hypothetical protein
MINIWIEIKRRGGGDFFYRKSILENDFYRKSNIPEKSKQ